MKNREEKREELSAKKKGMKQWGTGILEWVIVFLIDTLFPALQT